MIHLLQINATSDWGAFFGHFHPVVVHLPIGILFIAFVLELVRFKTKNNQLNSAVSIILFWGFITAIISCIFGWLLSLPGSYNEDTLFWHKWLGISVAAIAGLLWFIKKKTAQPTFKISKIYFASLLVMVALLTVTGHLGGSMTHGEDYLTANTPQPFRGWFGIADKKIETVRKEITDINEAVIYADVIAPVMEIKCSKCHNATKSKGSLRMDSEELLMKGGKHGPVVVAGNAEGSELIKRVLLPAGDDKRMPPEGKPGLTPDEISIIKWWIKSGASFTAKVKEVPQTEDVKPYFKNFTGSKIATGQTTTVNDTSAETPLSPVFQQKIAAGNPADIAALKKENLIVNPVSQNQDFLEVSAINAGGFDDGKMPLLAKLSQQIVWLKLASTKVTDAGIKAIGNFQNLVRLNMEGAAITNNSIATIKQLKNLEYLNIVATSIDDTGLLELASIKSLKNIYCWQTGITQKGVDALKTLNPGITVNFGEEEH